MRGEGVNFDWILNDFVYEEPLIITRTATKLLLQGYFFSNNNITAMMSLLLQSLKIIDVAHASAPPFATHLINTCNVILLASPCSKVELYCNPILHDNQFLEKNPPLHVY